MSDNPKQLKTVNLQGKEYAQVAERVKAFREKFPNSKIITKNMLTESGGLEFITYIWRDRKDYISGDLDSADSTGTARGVVGKAQKDFEKLETISVGRALALMGFLSSGEVASFEEMENYYADKEAERKLYIQGQVDLFDQAKTLDDLKELWSKTTKTEPDIVAAKDKRKAELEARSDGTGKATKQAPARPKSGSRSPAKRAAKRNVPKDDRGLQGVSDTPGDTNQADKGVVDASN